MLAVCTMFVYRIRSLNNECSDLKCLNFRLHCFKNNESDKIYLYYNALIGGSGGKLLSVAELP
jgi:hypothetical protein